MPCWVDVYIGDSSRGKIRYAASPRDGENRNICHRHLCPFGEHLEDTWEGQKMAIKEMTTGLPSLN